MRISDFDFDLPEDRIALRPMQPREAARLLRVDGGGLTDARVGDIGRFLRPGDLLVVNDTRVLPVQLQGRRVETIEGLAKGGQMSPLQQAFHEKLGTQCGFCTPGMIATTEALLRRNPHPDREEIKTALSGNLCRCTGYVKIIESVEAAAKARKAAP